MRPQTKPFETLVRTLSPEAQHRAKARTKAMLLGLDTTHVQQAVEDGLLCLRQSSYPTSECERPTREHQASCWGCRTRQAVGAG